MTTDPAAAALAAAVPPEAPPVADRGRSAALTAVGQIFVLVGASLIGVVVVATLSPVARLDAYFTASQVSVAALYVGQALRTSVPGLIVGGVVRAPVLRRAAMLATAVVAGALVIAAFLVPYLVPAASRGALRGDLLTLLPGAVLQVAAGYAAGRLAMAGRFAGAALAYAAGTLLNAVVLIALIGSQGAKLLAIAAVAGWLTSATLIGLQLMRSERSGEVVDPPSTPESEAVGVLGASGRILLSVMPILAAQLVIVAAVTAGASARDGGSSIVSLAFLAINAVGTVAVAPIPIVLSADLGSTWDRKASSLIPLMLSIVRLSAAVTMPLVLGLILIGKPVADVALGGLSPADVDDLFNVVLILLPSLPLTAASMVALVAVFSLDRLGRMARAVAISAALAAVSLALVVSAGGSLFVLALVASLWSAELGIAAVAVALRSHTPRAIAAILFEALKLAGPAMVVIAVALLSGRSGTLVEGFAWTLLGFAVHFVWLKLRHPAELNVLLGAVLRR